MESLNQIREKIIQEKALKGGKEIKQLDSQFEDELMIILSKVESDFDDILQSLEKNPADEKDFQLQIGDILKEMQQMSLDHQEFPILKELTDQIILSLNKKFEEFVQNNIKMLVNFVELKIDEFESKVIENLYYLMLILPEYFIQTIDLQLLFQEPLEITPKDFKAKIIQIIQASVKSAVDDSMSNIQDNYANMNELKHRVKFFKNLTMMQENQFQEALDNIEQYQIINFYQQMYQDRMELFLEAIKRDEQDQISTNDILDELLEIAKISDFYKENPNQQFIKQDIIKQNLIILFKEIVQMYYDKLKNLQIQKNQTNLNDQLNLKEKIGNFVFSEFSRKLSLPESDNQNLIQIMDEFEKIQSNEQIQPEQKDQQFQVYEGEAIQEREDKNIQQSFSQQQGSQNDFEQASQEEKNRDIQQNPCQQQQSKNDFEYKEEENKNIQQNFNQQQESDFGQKKILKNNYQQSYGSQQDHQFPKLRYSSFYQQEQGDKSNISLQKKDLDFDISQKQKLQKDYFPTYFQKPNQSNKNVIQNQQIQKELQKYKQLKNTVSQKYLINQDQNVANIFSRSYFLQPQCILQSKPYQPQFLYQSDHFPQRKVANQNHIIQNPFKYMRYSFK